MARLSHRRIQLFAIVVASLLASTAAVLLCVPVARINQSAAEEIRPGMTVGEAEAIIGGLPGWYDGVWGIRTDAPAYKGDKPFWAGNQGEITLELGAQGRVAEANFYPGEVLDRSVSKFVWERLTRNAFGTGRIDLVVKAGNGMFAGLLVACPLVVVAVLWRRQGSVVGPFILCLLGTIVALALLVLAVGVTSGANREGPFWLIGASASALIGFIAGSILTERRNCAEPIYGLRCQEGVEEARRPLRSRREG